MIKFKNETDKELFFKLHPLLIMVLGDIANYFRDNGKEFLITATISTLEEDQKLNRVSSSHRTCRAVDVRTNGIDEMFLKNCQNHFNFKYRWLGAVDSYGNSQLIVYKPHGTGPHFHIQIHGRFAINK